MLDEIQKRLLEEVADLHGVPEGAHNIRANGEKAARNTTADIDITTKTDKSGIDIKIKPNTKNQSVHIPEYTTAVRKLRNMTAFTVSLSAKIPR